MSTQTDTFDEKRTISQLSALYRIGNAISSTLELDEVLDRILSDTLALFKAEAGSIMLRKEDALFIRRAKGLSEEIIRNTAVQVGEGIAGHVCKVGEPLLLNGKVESEGSPFHGVVNRRETITSSICVPLRARTRIIGVMMLRRGGVEAFDEADLQFFQSVADQAAIAIENARLFAAEQNTARQLRNEQQKLESIFKAMADGVVVVDGDGFVQVINHPAEVILGVGDDFVGKSFNGVFTSFPLEHILEHLQTSGGTYECDLTAKSGTNSTVMRVSTTFWAGGTQCRDRLVLLLHDVTERVQVERMKTEFLSAVSHELKTPLTTITGFIELMSFKEMEREKELHYLSICNDEANRLQRLINDLLTLSKLESGRFELSCQRSNFDEIVATNVGNFSERYPNYTFTLNINEKPLVMNIDDVMVTQVIINLLSNAVKYSPGGGKIAVNVEAKPDKVIFTVSDEGVGIPQDKIPYVFDKFYRVDNSLTRNTVGTGLGLANTRYIVEGYGGSIWVESEEGKGSTFTFTLPRKNDEETTSEAVC